VIRYRCPLAPHTRRISPAPDERPTSVVRSNRTRPLGAHGMFTAAGLGDDWPWRRFLACPAPRPRQARRVSEQPPWEVHCATSTPSSQHERPLQANDHLTDTMERSGAPAAALPRPAPSWARLPRCTHRRMIPRNLQRQNNSHLADTNLEASSANPARSRRHRISRCPS
jgi:hypothetical protein